MTQSLYWLVVLLIYVGAARDYARLDSRIATPLRKCAGKLVLGLLTFHSIAGILFLINSDLQRAGIPFFWYVTNTLILIYLVPTGWAFARSHGSPAFPLVRALAGRGKLRDYLTKSRVAEIIGLVLFPICLTIALFASFDWRIDPRFVNAMKLDEHSWFANFILVSYLLISAPIAEELLLRHYLLNRMIAPVARSKRTLAAVAAVLFTSALFAMGHSSMTDPQWLKYAQTFLFGIALGIAQLRHGTEIAVLMHLVFNLSTVPVATLVK